MSMLTQIDRRFGRQALELFLAGTHTYREALQKICRDCLAAGWLPRRRTL